MTTPQFEAELRCDLASQWAVQEGLPNRSLSLFRRQYSQFTGIDWEERLVKYFSAFGGLGGRLRNDFDYEDRCRKLAYVGTADECHGIYPVPDYEVKGSNITGGIQYVGSVYHALGKNRAADVVEVVCSSRELPDGARAEALVAFVGDGATPLTEYIPPDYCAVARYIPRDQYWAKLVQQVIKPEDKDGGQNNGVCALVLDKLIHTRNRSPHEQLGGSTAASVAVWIDKNLREKMRINFPDNGNHGGWENNFSAYPSGVFGLTVAGTIFRPDGGLDHKIVGSATIGDVTIAHRQGMGEFRSVGRKQQVERHDSSAEQIIEDMRKMERDYPDTEKIPEESDFWQWLIKGGESNLKKLFAKYRVFDTGNVPMPSKLKHWLLRAMTIKDYEYITNGAPLEVAMRTDGFNRFAVGLPMPTYDSFTENKPYDYTFDTEESRLRAERRDLQSSLIALDPPLAALDLQVQYFENIREGKRKRPDDASSLYLQIYV